MAWYIYLEIPKKANSNKQPKVMPKIDIVTNKNQSTTYDKSNNPKVSSTTE